MICLIGSFADEKEAHLFCDFLSKKEGIACLYEAYQDIESGKHAVRVWIEDENDFKAATAWYERFKQGPQDFIPQEDVPLVAAHPIIEDIAPEVSREKKRFRIKVAIRPRVGFAFTMTNFFLSLCILIFFLNGVQEVKIAQEQGPLAIEMGFTPIEQKLLFDYPHAFYVLADVLRLLPLQNVTDEKSLPKDEQQQIDAAEALPYWRGIYDYFTQKKQESAEATPMFEKIRQGEVWRLFTPCLLHRGFLHILFNMAWLWILGKQIEERAGKLRLLALIIITAVVSDVTQYLISGPFFLGFSGVVVGMAGFIWMRQRVAPWEGYPLSRMVALFLLVFVLAMFALEIFTLALHSLTSSSLSANIANTAHVVGGLTGLLLGRLRVFAREAL